MTNVTITPGPAIGRLVREYRKERGLTLDSVARRVNTTISYLSKIERGDIDNPSIGIVLAIARAIGCTVGQLVGETPLDGEAERLRIELREIARRALEAVEVRP